MPDLSDMISEYMQNSAVIIESLEKTAADAAAEAEAYKRELEEAKASTGISKEAAIAAAGSLIGKGLISADNLSQTIDRLCADPLGVITQLNKVAVHQPPVPTMGAGSKKSGTPGVSTENLSKADTALLSALHII